MTTRAVIGVLLLVSLVVGLMLLPDDAGPGGSPTLGLSASPTGTSVPGAGAAPTPSGSSSSCLPCHAAVVDEWRASMHSRAFTDPQVRAPDQSDDFRKPECLPCHAPRPVFEYGIEEGSRVLPRTERRHEGVDCLGCHGLPEGGVAASRTGLRAACRPSYRQALASEALCAPCHNQHNTHDEWRVSPAAEAGESCRDCHMPRVARAGAEAGAPRTGRSHRFLGGRDREYALAGMELSHRFEPERQELVVSLLNRFAGHHLPTDSRNRALDLVVTLYDTTGAEVPPLPDVGDRHPGGETGTARLRFRKPYRSSGAPSTQIPAGETATLSLPVGQEVRRATLELFYKLEPWIPDTEAAWTHRIDVELERP